MTSFKTKKISKTSTPFTDRKRNYNNFDSQKIYTQYQQSHQKKKNPIRLISGILLIMSAFIFFGILALQAVGKMQLSNNNEFEFFNPIISLIEKEKPKDESKKWSKNILIAGIGWAGHPGWELTDSLMLANLNYDTKTVTLLSIPRDLYVAYSSNTAGKINALYQIGKKNNEWVNLLAKKISEITWQSIHHFLIIDFSGFKSIVDALGWVEVDVPQKIYDREYPNNTWWYEIFSLEKWLQTLDGKTALKFARSRHSTSDFDRSHRQQLLVRAIKDKALSLGIITNPTKISDLIESVRNNISTDLTVWELVDMGLHFKDINNENIVMYSYNDQCNVKCLPGSYLYTPVKELFGGAWVLLPETASRSRLSRYQGMSQFAENIFQFPHLQNAENSIKIITTSKNLAHARNIRKNLQQLGFPIDHAQVIVQTGSITENSSIYGIYNSEANTGFSENHILIQSLKNIEPKIPIEFGWEAKFSTGQTIEIILWNDAKNFFQFSNQSSINTVNTTNTTAKPKTPTATTTTDTQSSSQLILPSDFWENN